MSLILHRSPQVIVRPNIIRQPVCRGRLGIGNYGRLEAFNVMDGRTRWLTPWVHNHITDVGLDMCFDNAGRYSYAQVGTGNTAPADTDTTLQTHLAGSNAALDLGETAGGAPDYYIEHYFRYDFNTGAVVGNISEWGVGPSPNSGQNVFSRELVRDDVGAPTTATLQASETLRLHYKVRHYPPLSDSVATVNGTVYGAGETREVTRRAARLGTSNTSKENWGPTRFTDAVRFNNLFNPWVYDGAISGTTGYPSGTGVSATSVSQDSYTPGSKQATWQALWDKNKANFPVTATYFYAGRTGSSSVNTPARAGGAFQAGFDVAINKTSNDELRLDYLIAWDRYVAP